MLDDRDFISYLAPSRKTAAVAFLKKAGLGSFAAKNPEIIGGAIGAGILGLAEHATQKKNKEGITTGQRATRSLADTLERHQGNNFPSELATASGRAFKDITD